MNRNENERNGHYSEQTGHALRGEAERARRLNGGIPPKAVPGFISLGETSYLIRRRMRRTPDSGRG